ncbi:MAG: hypothetical protein EHM64_13920, partial [Ignavibacteriae bacterium]
SFDPRDIAYASNPIATPIDPPGQGAEAVITHYGIQDIQMQVTATGNNLLFLRETYYPKGWKATLDGQDREIVRLNYLFRGVVIPQGTHTLEMKFEPASFTLGKTISLITNLIVLCGIMLYTLRWTLARKKRTAVEK